MSVSLTEQAVVQRRKTVTRRLGWKFLKPGDTLTLCRKVQGRKPDEPLVRLAEVQVLSVRREPLWDITDGEVRLEGFNIEGVDRAAAAFVGFFCRQMGCTPDTEVTRIEWRYL
jgi:hypothetical protein